MIHSERKIEFQLSSQKAQQRRTSEIKDSQSSVFIQQRSKFANLREIPLQKVIAKEIFSLKNFKPHKFTIDLKKSETDDAMSMKSLHFSESSKRYNLNSKRKDLTERTCDESPDKRMKVSALYTSTIVSIQKLTTDRHDKKRKIETESQTQNFSQLQKQDISVCDANDQNSLIRKLKQINPFTPNKTKQLEQQQQQFKIEDFEILKFCGEGVFGSVFIARHKKTNFICALKKILKSSLLQKQDQQSFLRQIKIHSKLNHPNVVKFYGYFDSHNAIYFVLELCYSGNLFQMLQIFGTFDQKQLRAIIRQVCSGIDYLHSMNIIHRDIKAQNIIVQDKTVKICDFGWATTGQYSRKSLCGTPAYISPEVIQSKLYDKKIDVWSLGVLTYELFYGKIPFDIKSSDDFQKVINQDIIFPNNKQISPVCKDFILKCLEKNSFKRWDTSRLLCHPFLKKH